MTARVRSAGSRGAAALLILATVAPPAAGRPQAPETSRLVLGPGDRVVLVGNTLAERQQLFNHFETLLMTRHPDLRLVVRNLGWSGDTVTLQPRPLNFGDTALHLQRQQADVVIAFFGLNESFEGEPGLPGFERDLGDYLRRHLAASYNGRTPPRLALVSPIAHERLPRLVHPDVESRNRELARYTEAMRRVAAEHRIPFVDLFTPTAKAMAAAKSPLTINGIHVNEDGDRLVGELLLEALRVDDTSAQVATGAQLKRLEQLRELIRVKNEEFFRRWRPLNAEYVVGRRVEPFGSVSFPPEMRTLEERVRDLESQIWKRAAALKGVRYGSPSPATAAPGTSAEGRR